MGSLELGTRRDQQWSVLLCDISQRLASYLGGPPISPSSIWRISPRPRPGCAPGKWRSRSLNQGWCPMLTVCALGAAPPLTRRVFKCHPKAPITRSEDKGAGGPGQGISHSVQDASPMAPGVRPSWSYIPKSAIDFH